MSSISFYVYSFRKAQALVKFSKMANLEKEAIVQNVELNGEKKKKKKNKKKRELEEEPAVETVQTEVPKKKKKKSKDVAEATVENEEQEQENCPFKKCFYTMHEITAAMTKEEVQAYHDKHSIVLYGKGKKKFKPVLTFPEVGFKKDIMKICGKFETPTPIQVFDYELNLHVLSLKNTFSRLQMPFLCLSIACNRNACNNMLRRLVL